MPFQCLQCGTRIESEQARWRIYSYDATAPTLQAFVCDRCRHDFED